MNPLLSFYLTSISELFDAVKRQFCLPKLLEAFCDDVVGAMLHSPLNLLLKSEGLWYNYPSNKAKKAITE